MLAEAAARSGYRPLVIDLFGDVDMQRYAEASERVETLSKAALEVAVHDLQSRYRLRNVVFGSGLEQHLDSLEWLERSFGLLGNSADTLRRLQDKRHFFEVLDRFSIAYPAVSFAPPADVSEAWLIKPEVGEGGVGVCRYAVDYQTPGCYWQRYIDGVPGSVLFLANRSHALAVGFNTQWTEQVDERNEFLFGGIANKNPLSPKQTSTVCRWISVLTREYALRGLNSLDFIVAGERVYVLEINARPPASMQLYCFDLFEAHVKNSLKLTADRVGAAHRIDAYQIIYADRNLIVPELFVWPENCRDLPIPGSIIRKGQPICSIIARDKSLRCVRACLDESRKHLIQSLTIYKGD